jgi:hypothetical protein
LGREWAQEALHSVEEADQHFAAGECGEEVILVALKDGCSLVPKVVAVEEDVVDCVSFAAVWACDIVTGICSKAG